MLFTSHWFSCWTEWLYCAWGKQLPCWYVAVPEDLSPPKETDLATFLLFSNMHFRNGVTSIFYNKLQIHSHMHAATVAITAALSLALKRYLRIFFLKAMLFILYLIKNKVWIRFSVVNKIIYINMFITFFSSQNLIYFMDDWRTSGISQMTGV